MSDTPVPTAAPTPAPASTSKLKVNAEQDQQMANDIGEALEVLTAVGAAGNEAIAELLVPKGYTPEKIAAGLRLQDVAQTTFNTRQEAIGNMEKSFKLHDINETTARQHYADYRVGIRDVIPSDARTRLGLNNDIPDDLQKFVTTATASYTTAQTDASATILAENGYPAATLTAEIALLGRTTQSHVDFEKDKGDAKDATKNRDDAFDKLNTWMKQFRKQARIALRDEPVMLTKLKL